MQVSELQTSLDEMFKKGVRVCSNLARAGGGQVFWVARVVVLAENAILIKPVGLDYMVPYVFEQEPEFHDDGSVTFVLAGDEYRVVRLDFWAKPAGMEKDIAQEQALMDERWVQIQRADFAAEQESV